MIYLLASGSFLLGWILCTLVTQRSLAPALDITQDLRSVLDGRRRR